MPRALVKRWLGGENHGDAEAPAEQLHSRESPQMWELAFGFEQMGLRPWGLRGKYHAEFASNKRPYDRRCSSICWTRRALPASTTLSISRSTSIAVQAQPDSLATARGKLEGSFGVRESVVKREVWATPS